VHESIECGPNLRSRNPLLQTLPPLDSLLDPPHSLGATLKMCRRAIRNVALSKSSDSLMSPVLLFPAQSGCKTARDRQNSADFSGFLREIPTIRNHQSCVPTKEAKEVKKL